MPITFMSIAPSSNRMSSPTCTSLAKFSYDRFNISCSVFISGRPKIFTTSPVLYSIGASFPVVLTSGPLVSIRMPICLLTARVFRIICFIPSGVACAVFIRTTFIPASKSWRIKSTSHLRSLIEATILVCFINIRLYYLD